MPKIQLNSSFVPELFDVPDDTPDSDTVISEPVPEGMQWPQWVNNAWQEYRVEDDPIVPKAPIIISREV